MSQSMSDAYSAAAGRSKGEEPVADRMAEMPCNAFKAALRRRQLQIGLWSTMCSSIGAEIIASSGLDWILLDTEHSPNELPDLLAQLHAMAAGLATPVIRAAWNDAVLIKRILDLGAQSILLPYVQTADEALRAVAATRYPPLGIRGVSSTSRATRFGRIRGYFERAHEEVCLLVQVETKKGLEELERIASVDGVDGVFIGPADLAASLGHLGEPQHPEVQQALADAARRLRTLGKAAGILTAVESDAWRYIQWGYTFVAVGVDALLLAKGAGALARTFKSGSPTAAA